MLHQVEQLISSAMIATPVGEGDYYDVADTLIETVSHCFANCYLIAEGDAEKTMVVYNLVMTAYKVSGHGEGIVISALDGRYDYTKMLFLLFAACDPAVAAKRKERKANPYVKYERPSMQRRRFTNAMGRVINIPYRRKR